MGRFRRSKALQALAAKRRQEKQLMEADNRPVDNSDWCPCGNGRVHKMHPAVDWTQKTCPGRCRNAELALLVGSKRYARCSRCKTVYWADPLQNDQLLPVSPEGEEMLRLTLVLK